MPVYCDLPTSFHSKDNELYMKGEMIRNLPVGRAVINTAPPPPSSPFLRREKHRAMSDGKPPTGKLSLADLIAQTSGAQTREQLLERIKAREQARSRKKQKSAPAEDQLATPDADRQ
jgi:hypothetical protein